MRMHVVRSDIMVTLGYSSKLNAEWAFLEMLREEGRKAAQAFLERDAHNIGKRSSIDFDAVLQGI
jgi:NTE family protein